MDRQARLYAIMHSITEYGEKKEQAKYGAELAIKTGEWDHLKRCAEKLLAIELLTKDLTSEAKELQQKIEDEAKETIL